MSHIHLRGALSTSSSSQDSGHSAGTNNQTGFFPEEAFANITVNSERVQSNQTVEDRKNKAFEIEDPIKRMEALLCLVKDLLETDLEKAKHVLAETKQAASKITNDVTRADVLQMIAKLEIGESKLDGTIRAPITLKFYHELAQAQIAVIKAQHPETLAGVRAGTAIKIKLLSN